MVKLINRILDVKWFNLLDMGGVLQYRTHSDDIFYDYELLISNADSYFTRINDNVLFFTGTPCFYYFVLPKIKYYRLENISIYYEIDNSDNNVKMLALDENSMQIVIYNVVRQEVENIVFKPKIDFFNFVVYTLTNNIILFIEGYKDDDGEKIMEGLTIKATDIRNQDKEILWTFDTRQLSLAQKRRHGSSWFLTTWHNESIFLSADEQYIFSLDYRTGELLWKYKDERNRYLFFASLETETATLIRNTGGYYTVFDLNERSIIEYEKLYDNKEIRKKWGIHGENHIRKGNIRVFIGETMGDEQIFYIVIWDMKENVELYTHRLCDVSVFAGCEMYDNKVYVRIKDVLNIYEVEI